MTSQITFLAVVLHLPHEQAGFHKGHSTTDLVARLTNEIETAFQRKEKYGAIFIDLSAAYDTIWHRGLYSKLLKTIPGVKLVRLIMTLWDKLQKRSFVLETSTGEQSVHPHWHSYSPQLNMQTPENIPVWAHSSRTSKVDGAINDALRLISGAIAPTPMHLLPVVAGIPPLTFAVSISHSSWTQKQISPVTLSHGSPTMSRHWQHFARRASEIKSAHPLSSTWLADRWRAEWTSTTTRMHHFVKEPSMNPPRSQLSHRAWVRLNRLRTGWGKAQHFLCRIGATNSDACSCGAVQMIEHIISSCPIFKHPLGNAGLAELDRETVYWLER